MTEVKLRFGVVGLTSDHVWGMGDGLAALPEVEIVSAADGYPEPREQAAGRWGLERTYEGHAELLERERVDAILVCCDNAGKAEIVECAASHGVHVYQDKPMAATLEQARRIADAAERTGITLMVAYHRAFDPVYEEVRGILAGGALGTLYLARGVIGHGGPVEFGCSRYFCEWLFDRERNGGGSFIDEACYLVDDFVDRVGPIREVSAFTAQMGIREYLPPGVEDNAVAILRFENGALGVIDSKWGQVGPAPVLTSFHGTAGTLTGYPGYWTLYSTAQVEPPATWEPMEASGSSGLRAWRREAPPRKDAGRGGIEQRSFVDHVLRGRRVEGAASPAVALHAQEVIEAAYRSVESGCAVRIGS
jgi:predicted dehydrogenase